MENKLKIKDQNLKKKKHEKEIKEGNLKNKIIVIYNFNSKKKKLSLTLFYYTRDTYTLCIRFVFVSILKYIFYQNFNIFPIKKKFNIFKKKGLFFYFMGE